MSAVGPSIGNRERALRSYDRLKTCLTELEALRDNLSCPACIEELERQLQLQREAIREVGQLWEVEE
jgi:hypothetical protein